MLVSASHRKAWQQRLKAEAAAIAERRALAERQALVSASLLQARWPQIQAVWLFGSVLEPGFGLESDLDLCVEGLPSSDLFAAMELLDSVDLNGTPVQGVQRSSDPLPVDLVRLEALPPHWQQRLRERARLLA